MADEIAITLGLNVNKSNLSVSKNWSDNVDLSGTLYSGGVQTIGTSHELLVITGDISTAGVAYFKNLDATNYVEVGRDVSSTFYPLVKLKPGEAALLRLATTSVYAKANTSAINLEYLIMEN